MEECGLQRANIIAENAALGATEEGVMKMRMLSLIHRDNIMNPRAKEFGTARAGNFWTQTFVGSYL
jgi:uncharacterized protein YkwD